MWFEYFYIIFLATSSLSINYLVATAYLYWEKSRSVNSIIICNSDLCHIGRRLCAELLLGVSLQRGSLRYLLQWADLALTAPDRTVPLHL